jgi:hypothetical protein
LVNIKNKIQAQNGMNQIKPLKQIHEDINIESEKLFLETY